MAQGVQAGPSLIFGAATVGQAFRTVEQVSHLLISLKKLGIKRIDTTAKYPPSLPGLSEELLGAAGAADLGFVIDTKISCNEDGKGSLTREAIKQSLNRSLANLCTNRINILYCHRTDPDTPLEETAETLNDVYSSGKIITIGVCNFPLGTLKQFVSICKRNGFVLPTVYQGQYNIVYRESEELLFPFLRENNMSFVAFRGFHFLKSVSSPLAGSALVTPSPQNLRFGVSALYTTNQAVLDRISELCSRLSGAEPTISLPTVALRYLYYHSGLSSRWDDAMILGASKIEHLEENVHRILQGQLTDEIQDAVNSLWGSVKDIVLHSDSLVFSNPQNVKSVTLRVWQEWRSDKHSDNI